MDSDSNTSFLTHFNDLHDLNKKYYVELKSVLTNHEQISKSDFIVMYDLSVESTKYSQLLSQKGLHNESKSLTLILTKINRALILILKNTIDSSNTMNFDIKYYQEILLLIGINIFEVRFQTLFYLNNFEECEKLLLDIYNLQKKLNVNRFNIANCLIRLCVVKLFLLHKNIKNSVNIKKNIDEIENMAQEALSNYETNNDKNVIENSNILKKISLAFELLGNISEIVNQKGKSVSYYEKAYYLNLGFHGKNNVNTKYFKVKLDILYENFQNPLNLIKMNEDLESKKISSKDELILAENQKEIKGKTKTYKFSIRVTNNYEPLILKIFSLNNDNLIKNLYFDKTTLCKYFGVSHFHYDKIIISKLIKVIALNDEKLIFSDPNFKKLMVNYSSI